MNGTTGKSEYGLLCKLAIDNPDGSNISIKNVQDLPLKTKETGFFTVLKVEMQYFRKKPGF